MCVCVCGGEGGREMGDVWVGHTTQIVCIYLSVSKFLLYHGSHVTFMLLAYAFCDVLLIVYMHVGRGCVLLL